MNKITVLNEIKVFKEVLILAETNDYIECEDCGGEMRKFYSDSSEQYVWCCINIHCGSEIPDWLMD